jgi:hypothetical protein
VALLGIGRSLILTSRLRIAAILGILLMAGAAGQKFDEYQVKAAFLCNFANFVEWPAAAFNGPGDPLSICVLGRNPFGNTLQNLIAGKSVEGRTFVVREIEGLREAGSCQILFISSSERLRFRSILESLKGQSVLSVGDTNDFIADGGVVDLRLEGGKVRVEINSQAAKERNLRISPHLLELAKGPR